MPSSFPMPSSGPPASLPSPGSRVSMRPILPFPVISPTERAARARMEKAEAEQRLRAAEQRLRSAIDEMHRSSQQPSFYGALFRARHPLCPHGDSCVANALGSLCQSFLLAYGVRVGVGVLLRAFKLLRSNRPVHSVLDLQLLLSEQNLVVREEACRVGLLFGAFAGAYHAARCLLRRARGRETPANAIVAGSLAGLSILSLDNESKRRSLALYILARLGQCAFNSAEAHGKLKLWRGPLRHGATVLFALSSAQIMYAYVMRPETLPESYLDFIVRTGPMPRPVLQAVRESCREQKIDVANLSGFLQSYGKEKLAEKLGEHAPIIPCSAMHPQSATCLRQNGRAMTETFKKTFPLYMSLTLVPYVVLNLHKFMQAPLLTIWTAIRSALRSTSFISAFVGIYQAAICLHRKASPRRDHKGVYWAAGLLAGGAALLERPARRTELALYVGPRAADALWTILTTRNLLPPCRHAEVALFCASMGALMYFHEHEPHTLAPFLRGILTRFLNRTGFPLTDPAAVPLISPGSFHNLRSHRNPDEIWPAATELDLLLDDNGHGNRSGGGGEREGGGGERVGEGQREGEGEGERKGTSGRSGRWGVGENGKAAALPREKLTLDAEKVIEKLKSEAFQGL